MLFQPSDAALIVCTTVLCTAQGGNRTDMWASVIAAKVNSNFPNRHLTTPDIHNFWRYININLFDWTEFIYELNKTCQGWRILTRHLDAGLLVSESLPDAPITTEGLEVTMARIVRQARLRGVENGLFKRREYERTKKNDEFGYGTDDSFYWWDHPGNIGV